jgi:hypothetical protein
MDIQEFASMLDGRSEGSELTMKEQEQAKQLGLVVVFGYSDDNTEFRGAIDDEDYSWDGGEIYLDKDGLFEECTEECKYSKAAKAKCKAIEAVWCGSEGYAWTYKTDIPHATFDILDEEGNKWCKGIVFEIESLQ